MFCSHGMAKRGKQCAQAVLCKSSFGGDGAAQIDAGDSKPFAPKSYRDFMLSEQHYINAASNYARANMPGAYKVAQLYKN